MEEQAQLIPPSRRKTWRETTHSNSLGRLIGIKGPIVWRLCNHDAAYYPRCTSHSLQLSIFTRLNSAVMGEMIDVDPHMHIPGAACGPFLSDREHSLIRLNLYSESDPHPLSPNDLGTYRIELVGIASTLDARDTSILTLTLLSIDCSGGMVLR